MRAKNGREYAEASISLLLDAGGDPNIQCKSGLTALMFATRDGKEHREAMIRTLIYNGADQDIMNNAGYTAMRMDSNPCDNIFNKIKLERMSLVKPVDITPSCSDASLFVVVHRRNHKEHIVYTKKIKKN